jgi:hypothetical protein
MQPIRVEDIKEPTAYERVRSEIRRQVIELRTLRRLQLGGKFSVVFENRETVLYQVQEMLRAERITDEPTILRELETHNEMLPKPGCLAGTLFVELTEPRKIREALEELVGLNHGEHVWFDLGEAGRVLARFAEGQREEGRVASVHYVRFPFTREAAGAFRDLSHPVFLVAEHPSCRAKIKVEGATRRSLIEDLTEE